MTNKKGKTLLKLLTGISLLVFGLLILFIANAFLRLFVFDTEQRDYDLYDQFMLVAENVESYKKRNGHYPEEISIVSSNRICSLKYINFCTTIKYNVLPDGTGFRMAARSISWPVFYYHSDYSPKASHIQWARPEGSVVGEDDPFQTVYKETKPIFEHPEEWPNL